MNQKILPVVFSGSLCLAAPLFAQESNPEAPPIVDHVVIPVDKEPLEGVVVKRTAIHAEGGRSIIMQKIAQPELPEAPASEPAARASELQAFRASHPQGIPRTSLGITATIYDHYKTLLEWSFEGERFAAWSNVDFNYLTQTSEVSTANAVYLLMLFPVNADTTALAHLAQEHGKTYQPPTIPAFASNDPSFVMVQGNATNAAAQAPIAALLQYYSDNTASLKAAHAQRMADAAAQKVYDEAHPKLPKDTTVQFWKREAPTAQSNQQEGGQ